MSSENIKYIARPPVDFLEWWERNLFFENAQVSGACIPDFYSNLNNISLVIPKKDFGVLKKHLTSEGTMHGISKFSFSENSGALEMQINSQIYYCTLAIENLETETTKPKTTNNPAFVHEQYLYSIKKPFWHIVNSKIKIETLDTLELQNEKIGLPFENFHPIIKILIVSAKMDLPLSQTISESLEAEKAMSNLMPLKQKEIGQYLMQIIQSKKPGRAFFSMHDLGILKWFLPELDSGFGLSQNRFHKHDIAPHCIYTCDAVNSPDPGLKFAALFHDIGKVDTRKIKSNGEASFYNHEVVSTRLTRKIFNRTGLNKNLGLLKRVIFLVRNHMFHYTNDWTDKAIRRFIQKVNTDQLDDLIKLRLADRKGSGKRSSLPHAIKELIRHIDEVRARESELKIKDLNVSGYDLMKSGIKAGPEMGALLKTLLQEVKNDELQNEFDTLMCRVEQLLNEEKRFPELCINKNTMYSGSI